MPDVYLHRRRVLGLILLCGALGLNLTACSSSRTKALKSRDLALERTTEAYRKLMRWSYFEEAAKYMKGRDTELRRPALARYEAWKVAAYDVSDMVRNKTGDEARMVVQISVYSKETGTVSSVRDDQFWWYDENESRWYLGSPFPDFDATTR